jgi:hypothetical protein
VKGIFQNTRQLMTLYSRKEQMAACTLNVISLHMKIAIFVEMHIIKYLPGAHTGQC